MQLDGYEDTKQIGAKLKDRADGAISAKLRMKSSSEEVIVGNAHATWWHDDDPPIAGKVVQIMIIARALQDYARCQQIPIECTILCGDFNSMAVPNLSASAYHDTAGYELITKGYLPVEHRESPQSHGWALPALTLT